MEVYKNKTSSMINLVIAGKLIETTPGHLFRLSQGAWRPASELKVGDTVITSDGTEATVESTEKIDYDEDIDIYNLNVADFHTYFVADTGVLVHNNCGGNIGEIIVKVEHGYDFGKMGIYVEHPDITVDWSKFTEHGLERMNQRGITQEMVNDFVQNGKALSQNEGNKFAFITKSGVAVVSKEGKLITTWGKDNFDANMKKIVAMLWGE